MGIFSKSVGSEFKNVFIDTLNKIFEFSQGTNRVSDKLIQMKIDVQLNELIEIAKRSKDLEQESFNIYMPSIHGLAISISCGLLIAHDAFEMAKNGMRITHEQLMGIISYSQNDVKSSYGKIRVKMLLENK